MAGDLDRLQGAWSITALEIEGRPMPAGAAGIEIQGDRFTSSGMGAEYSGTIELDSSRKPKRFDLLFSAGPESGNRSLGIYELEGDIWRICLGLAGKTRPRGFKTAPGSGHALETLTRGPMARPDIEASAAPAGTGTEPPPTASGLVDDLSGEWQMVSCIRDGYALEPIMVRNGRRIGRGDQTTTLFGGRVFMKARYTLDLSRTPCWIDYFITSGEGQGKTQHGIYELDGGLLRICYTAPGQARPTDFHSSTGDGKTVTVWKRA